MALKKVLVYGTDGEIEQLQAGDYTREESYVGLINGEASAIIIGTPVYSSGADTVKKCDKAAIATAKCVGLAVDSTIAAGITGQFQIDGVFEATTAQWDAVAGTTGGLVPNATYFLGASGLLTSVVPTTGISAPIGTALSPTSLRVAIQRVIKL